jgi:hypothetical protein
VLRLLRNTRLHANSRNLLVELNGGQRHCVAAGSLTESVTVLGSREPSATRERHQFMASRDLRGSDVMSRKRGTKLTPVPRQ